MALISCKLYLALSNNFNYDFRGVRGLEYLLERVFPCLLPFPRVLVDFIKGHIVYQMTERKRKQVIDTIARESINPQTNTPHPPARISQAIDEAKVHIDPFKSVSEQVQIVLKAIKPLLPIRMEKTKLAVRLTGDAYGKVYGEIVREGYLMKEEWSKDGSWIGLLEVPAGMASDIMGALSRRGQDNIEIKVVNGK